MCIGNRAETSERYINGQLGVLWDNARHCTEKHGTGLKPTSSVVEYATCLFEYYGPGKHGRYQPSKQDLTFFATFGKPKLEFVCNHEVILYLELVSGHYNLDYSKSYPNKSHNEKIDNYVCAFRINFTTHSVEKFHCKEIGNLDSYIMDIHVLDTDSAVFVTDLSSLPGITTVTDEKSFHVKEAKLNALKFYLLKHYLQTFKHAGFHVLHSLPDFDNLTDTIAHVDYSVISQRTDMLSTDTLYGVSIKEINEYLSGLWLQAAGYIDEHGTKHHDEKSILETFLAEHRSIWSDSAEDIHFHLYLGPMRVRALCKREVVLFVNLHKLHVHIGGGFLEKATHDFDEEWKLAFIVNVKYEESEDKTVKSIKLDLSSARECEHLSTIPSKFHDAELFTRIKKTLFKYIRQYYFAILDRSSSGSIYHHDERVHHGGNEISYKGSEHEIDSDIEGEEDTTTHHGKEDQWKYLDDCSCTEEGSCGHKGVKWGLLESKRLSSISAVTESIDTVMAVTQGALNANIRQAWVASLRKLRLLGENKRTWASNEIEEQTCLADYSFVHKDHGDEVFFSASFVAPKIQLVCREGSQKAILYIHITQGFMKTLGNNKSLAPENQTQTFANWHLAFEVDLKIEKASKETVSEATLKHLDRKEIHGFKQLILDLSTAKFNLSLSSVPGLLDGEDWLLIRKRREAIVHYMMHHYFRVLRRARHHVLYTIPTVVGEAGASIHTVTSVEFEIVPFVFGQKGEYVEGLFGRHKGLFDRNAIVFLCLTKKHDKPKRVARGHNWVCGGERHQIPHGAICLSRRTFLEGRVLHLLEAVNRDTTIVPEFLGVHKGDWKLRLTTWGKHATKKELECAWHEVKKSEESLDFEWRNRELWRYEHEGDVDGNGLYTVECLTHNMTSVPTSRRGTSAINIKGTLDFSMSYSGNGRKWSASTKGSWSAVILFSSGARGLHVTLTPAKIIPHFTEEKQKGELGHSVHELAFKHLQEEFPKVIDFSAIVTELKGSFEGCWTGLLVESRELVVSHPIFNRNGDLLLELVPRGSETASVRNSVSSAEGSTSTANGELHHSKSSNSLFRSVESFVHKGIDAIQGGKKHTSTVSSSSSTTISRSSSSSTIKHTANGVAESKTVVAADTSTIPAKVAIL